jgi:hypothetical protein
MAVIRLGVVTRGGCYFRHAFGMGDVSFAESEDLINCKQFIIQSAFFSMESCCQVLHVEGQAGSFAVGERRH